MPASANGYPGQPYRDGQRSGSNETPGYQRRVPNDNARHNARTPLPRHGPFDPNAAARNAAKALGGLARKGIVGGIIELLQDELIDLIGDYLVADGFARRGWTRACGTNGTAGEARGGAGASCSNAPLATFVDGMEANGQWVHGTYVSATFVRNVHFWTEEKRPHPGDATRVLGRVSSWWFKNPVSFGVPGSATPLPGPGYNVIEGDDFIDSPHWLPDNPGVAEPVPATVDPWQRPIQQTTSEPEALPYRHLPLRRENYWRSPSQQSSRGNIAPRDVIEAQNRSPLMPPVRQPGEPIVVPPLVNGGGLPMPEITWPSGVPSGRPTHAPGRAHVRKPPGRRVKEKKFIVSGVRRGVTLGLLEMGSEFKDVVEAFWESLPLRFRTLPKGYILPKGVIRQQKKKPMPTVPEMLKDLYRNWEHIDGQKAVEGIIQNEIGDRIGAAIGKASAKASRRANFSHGIQTGPMF